MKITEKQLLMLYQVLMDSLLISDGGYTSLFKYHHETRRLLANEINNQQSDTLVKISDLTISDKFICKFCGSSEGTPLALTCNPPIECCTVCNGQHNLRGVWVTLGEQNA